MRAKEPGIVTVAAINSITFPQESILESARQKTHELKEIGVTYFQIDGIFEDFLRE